MPPTDKHKLISTLNTVCAAIRSGDATLIAFSESILNAQLAALPDNWMPESEPESKPADAPHAP